MDNNKKEIENEGKENEGKENIEDNKKSTEIPNTSADESVISGIFNKSNFILIAWFLGIYFIAYFILGYFFPGSSLNNQGLLSKTIDILLVACFLIIVITTFYSMNDNQKNNFISNFLLWFKDFLNNPNSLLIMVSFILVLYLVAYLFRFPMTSETKSMGLSFIESTSWILIILLMVVNFFNYFLQIPIIDILINLFGLEETKEEEKKEEETPLEQGDEVFNVSNNLYTYEDAQAICSSYDAKLANYDQIEAAYNDGAEWCNYGWSDGQMIFFPTQKASWDKLQETDDHKNDCGRPGVNGGYNANPYSKFGVNCYGKKPKAKNSDINHMNSKETVIHPKNKKDIELEEKVNYWKKNADKMLNINSFNANRWFESWSGTYSGNTVSK